MNIDEYSYLWDGTQSGWGLLKKDDTGYTIFDTENSVMLKIDDVNLQHVLCEKMLSSGVKIIEEVQPVSVEVIPSNKPAEVFFKKKVGSV